MRWMLAWKACSAPCLHDQLLQFAPDAVLLGVAKHFAKSRVRQCYYAVLIVNDDAHRAGLDQSVQQLGALPQHVFGASPVIDLGGQQMFGPRLQSDVLGAAAQRPEKQDHPHQCQSRERNEMNQPTRQMLDHQIGQQFADGDSERDDCGKTPGQVVLGRSV